MPSGILPLVAYSYIHEFPLLGVSCKAEATKQQDSIGLVVFSNQCPKPRFSDTEAKTTSIAAWSNSSDEWVNIEDGIQMKLQPRATPRAQYRSTCIAEMAHVKIAKVGHKQRVRFFICVKEA